MAGPRVRLLLAVWLLPALALVAGFFATVIVLGVVLEAALGADHPLLVDPVLFSVPLGAAFVAGGLALGFAQLRLLRRLMPDLDAKWALAYAPGMAVLIALYAALLAAPELANEVVHNVAGGLVIGYLQWRGSLGGDAARRWWIGVPALALLAGGLSNFAISAAVPDGPGMPIAFLVLAGILAAGALRLPLRPMTAPPPAAVTPRA